MDKLFDMYVKHIDNEYKLASFRNDILVKFHGRLPSYCYWCTDDIEAESIPQRREWLVQFIKTIPSEN